MYLFVTFKFVHVHVFIDYISKLSSTKKMVLVQKSVQLYLHEKYLFLFDLKGIFLLVSTLEVQFLLNSIPCTFVQGYKFNLIIFFLSYNFYYQSKMSAYYYLYSNKVNNHYHVARTNGTNKNSKKNLFFLSLNMGS